jgi:hypothetical protein
VSETQTLPRHLSFVTPSTWWRIPLPDPDARRRSVEALVKRQFAALDDQLLLRRSASDEIAAAAEAAAANSGLEMYMSTELIGGVPLGISLVVTWIPAAETTGGLPALAAQFGENGDETTVLELPVGRVVRRRRTARPPEADRLGAVDDSVLVDFLVPSPADDGFILLSFSTPLLPLAEPLAELFEAVASTAQWAAS